MSCDICGNTGTELCTLIDEYKTSDIQAICPDCERIINRKGSKLLTFVLNMRRDLLKRFMRNMKGPQ